MYQSRQQVVEQLGIDVDRLFETLSAGTGGLGELDQAIVCQALQGLSPQAIARSLNLPRQKIRDRLSTQIYPGFAALMQVEQSEVAGNWVMILNFLLSPTQGYRLTPAPQLNQDNFQASFGRQVFLSPPDQQVVELQTNGAQFYQQGRYYQAAKCFLWAWQQEKAADGQGNPEVLIYLNNALLELQNSADSSNGIEIYTIAVVVPFHHNQGQIAIEVLRGVAQLQLQINWPVVDQVADQANLRHPIDLNSIRPASFFTLSQTARRIGLKILVVNDPNNLYSPQNQTAEQLAQLAEPLNLMAVMGHYSSEMTQKALNAYAQQGLALVNFSSTSDQLSRLTGGERLSFFRLTTPDQINAARLAAYLVQAAPGRRTAIIYNQNSSYSNSYRAALTQPLAQAGFTFLEACGDLGRSYYHIQAYLDRIRPEVELILLIPDGGLEPNSLNNAGLISRLNLRCLIAGSATFYQENVLHWIDEQSQRQSGPEFGPAPQLVACVPWHWQSRQNGAASENSMARQFCQVGQSLWGAEQLSWRSATAFDALLLILRAIERHPTDRLDRQALLVTLNRCFKEQSQEIKGVTGRIKFDLQGNRLEPAAEIAAVGWDRGRQQWRWQSLT